MKTRNTHTDLKQVLGRIRNYEIKLRKAVSGSVAGEIKSLVKGTGLEFDDVRPYQYGDDVRVIDWNVSAKGQGTYIKTFIEDKDQTVWVLFDLSASTRVDSDCTYSFVKELASVLYLSTVNQGSNTGVIGFTNELEYITKPSKNNHSAIGSVTKILKYNPKQKETSLSTVLKKSMALMRSKCLVLMVSDFVDDHYGDELKVLAQKHEVMLFDVSNAPKKNVPLGIIPVRSAEGRGFSMNVFTLFGALGKKSASAQKRENYLKGIVHKTNIDYLKIQPSDDYMNDLIGFFKKRNLRR